MKGLPHMRLLAVPALAITLSACGTITSWFRGEDNREPPAELTEFTPSMTIVTRWSLDVGEGTDEQQLRLVPTVDDGRVFAADRDGRVEAMEAASGHSIWVTETGLPFSGGPGAGEGLVLIGSSDGDLLALAEEDGKERWRTALHSEILSVPATASDIVVVHTIDGKVYGLDAASGEQIWVHQRSVPTLTLRGSSSPVIDGSNVIVGFAGGKLANLDLIGGTAQWEIGVTPPHGRSELDRIVDIDSDPAIYDGMIYVATFQGDLAAVTEDTGVVLWRRKLSSHAGLSVDWRQIYITDSNDYVWGIDSGNGAALWKQGQLFHRRLTAPAILEDYVIVGDLEGYVHWLSYEDGSLLARVRISDAPIRAMPRVVDDVVYIYADDGTLAALGVAGMETQEADPETETSDLPTLRDDAGIPTNDENADDPGIQLQLGIPAGSGF